MNKESGKLAKERIDILVSEIDGVVSRERARALIMAGKVFVNGRKAEKAGEKVPRDSVIEVKEPDHPYVSRGGVKLESALRKFDIDPTGMSALDIGSSTGGFTDCLLQFGAERIHALDVGKGLIDYKLRKDDRVNLIEGLNARYLEFDHIGEKVDIVVADVAFISLTLIIPRIPVVLKDGGIFLPLVKPQFEVGKGEVEKGGIIRTPEKRLRVLEKIINFSREYGFLCSGAVVSPIKGRKGNTEYLLLFDYKTEKRVEEVSIEELRKLVFGD
jgi:23S rRNA (cytidine1920-2'-O)/16S rRNA (cytidine1409-2'-O)-methyltransferase